MTFDKVNAVFEVLSGLFLFLNVHSIIKSKSIAGVCITPAMFFTIWGVWNMIYYPAILQWWSFYAAILVTVANGLWVLLALYYKRKNSKGAEIDILYK